MSESDYSKYVKDLISIFWKYQKETFTDREEYFECPCENGSRPPVFKKGHARYNVIMKQDISDTERKQLLELIPVCKRHRWFRSMRSSQALAQSVFGNLKLENKLHYLCEITDDEGKPIFEKDGRINEAFSLEYTVHYLNEPRPTSIDAFIDGEYRVSIECKLSEQEFGSCSRPSHCDGNFIFKKELKDRCSLTSKRVLYWKYIPDILKWSRDIDHKPCPLYRTYQLVRNILAACVKPNGTIQMDKSYAVLIYDERNPAFRQEGDGMRVFTEVQEALHNPSMIRKCSWQKLLKHLRSKSDLTWLTELHRKYDM